MRLNQNIAKPWIMTVAAILAMAILSPFLLSGMVKLAVTGKIKNVEELCRTQDVILVLGCGIKANGEPSDMLEDRLKTGVELYFGGAAPKLLLSGDHEQEDYNEVAVMKQYCLEAGVPEDAILCDRYGLSTYDSIVRACTLFGVKRAVIVTQEYHLYRALYIAEKTGVEAVGVSADIRAYRLQWYRDLREVLARCKDYYTTQREVSPKYPTEN